MKVTLDHIEEIAPNIRTFWFKPEKDIRYTAGQFIELRIPHDDKDKRGDKRWFTLSSSPTEPLVSITTKFAQESSSFKKALSALQPGDQIDMSSPMGDFVAPKDTATPVLFVAGGIGCTPYRSMVKASTDAGDQRPIQVLYAASTVEEVAFAELFKSASNGLVIVPSNPSASWSGPSGRLNAKLVLDHVTDPENQIIYVSGPEPMIEALYKELKDNGFNKKHIRTDYFPGYTEV